MITLIGYVMPMPICIGGVGDVQLPTFSRLCLIAALVFAFLSLVYILLDMIWEDFKGSDLPFWPIPMLMLISLILCGLAGLSALLN